MNITTAASPLVERLGAATLERAVRERYEAVAAEPGGDFNFRVGRKYAVALGYPPALLDRLPPGSVARFTGVATPVFAAALQPGERVLDLGCGAGVDTAVAAEAVGPSGRVVAVDLAMGMVKCTAAAAEALGAGWVLPCLASAEALPLPTASVDVVLVNGLFNLAPRKAAVLAEVARVTRPGGRLVAAETVLTRPLEDGELTSVEDWFR